MQLRLTALLAAALAVACADPITPSGAHSQFPNVLSDGATGGNPHFFFLPPMVARPDSADGPNDRDLSPVVVVCQYTAGCVTTLATYTTDRATTTTTHPGNSEVVRSGGSHYIVNWHTGAFDLDPALGYRICVSVGGVELGFADVDVVESGADLSDVPADVVGVHNGRTLPIKFRIEAGALDQPATSGCGSESPE